MKRGKSIPLSNERRLICDVIKIARQMPLAPVARRVDVSKIRQLRRLAEPRISWQVIMMRAFGLVARETPRLRQIYSPWPRPRLYEHPESVCLLTFAREFEGQERLFFARFCQPENHSLTQLQEQFDRYRRLPVHSLRPLLHQVRFAAMPRPVRSLGWKLMTCLMPASRARQMGTFGMSLSGFRGVQGTFHLGPCTTTLGYDQLCRQGKAYMTLTFDHRVLDGKPASDALEMLDEVLKNRIVRELQMIQKDKPDIHSGASARPALRLYDPDFRAGSAVPQPVAGEEKTVVLPAA